MVPPHRAPFRGRLRGRENGTRPEGARGGPKNSGGECPTQCPTGCPIPPPAVGGVAPVCMYPYGKAPRPVCGPDDEQRRAAPCLTDSSARSWSSAA